ncbi:tumor necrosis factor receptor superfamily member 6 isoform X2 [Ornithorhynchus anatinus]|uniref:tumor necrosis factor receptor superfamily member 6 isoform X2 n=1 Tax=Ornithorhynchus anatinus TaxID=9258 RepID=UPI0010A8F896|nr:tumor necrosis factor receptor superfamily member 6 isoform X2 [Ornithorhynchus anatinus]
MVRAAQRVGPPVLLCLFGILCESYASPMNHGGAQHLERKRSIFKREVNCSSNQYLTNGLCCEMCPAGSVVAQHCNATGNKPKCEACIDGFEFMDHSNGLGKCLRCGTCDEVVGLIEEEPCRTTQNVKCKCKDDYVCLDPPCVHCTTVPQTGNSAWWFLSLLPLILVVGCAVYFLRKRRKKKKFQLVKNKEFEMIPIRYPDIDLSGHIIDIADRMTISDVKCFVRKSNITPVIMDQILHDHLHDTAEQKVQLLRRWYQSHGMKGAFRTLITSLREAKLCALADEIMKSVEGAENGNTHAPMAVSGEA